MMKFFTTVFLMLICTTTAFSQTYWERNYGGTGNEDGASAVPTSGGGYIAVGYTTSFGNSYQIYLVKTDSFGDTIWTKVYGGTSTDYGSEIQQTSDGGYILTAYSYTTIGGQVYLMKTNASGDSVWARTYGGASFESGNSVQQTSDLGYIVAGSTLSFGNDRQVYLVKTNASGDTLWTRTYGGTDYEDGNAVQQTSDGGYIVAGFTVSFGNGDQIYLVKTNASGDTLWTRTYGGASEERGYSVQQTSDLGYIVAGSTLSFGNGRQVYLVKTNASGDTLWTRTYGGSSGDEGYSVCQTADSGYIVAGATTSFGNASQAYLVKTDVSGGLLWNRNYGGTSADYAYSVQQTSDLGYIVAGTTSSFGDSTQLYLIKTDANGSININEYRNPKVLSQTKTYVAISNPFISYTAVRGCENEIFIVYDVSGSMVGHYEGRRIGEGLAPGVYILKSEEQKGIALRVVKIQ